MAEGWQRRTPEAPMAGASPWWSDGYRDPWRDPRAPAVVVVPPGASPPGASPPGGLEPVPDPDSGPRRGLGVVFLISLVTALLAGALGGSLGYALGIRGGATGPLGGPPVAAPPAAQRPPDSLAGVARRVLPSLVTVRVNGAATASLGSGFVVTADGHVITNDHVVGAARSVTLAFADGTTTAASVTGRDPESDLAVLRVSGARSLTPVEFGDSDAVAVGDPVLAFGAPLALANTVTAGIVSALDRPVQAGEEGGAGQVRYYAAIQTDAAINQGNSGGPLVDGAGRVIGVNSSIRSLAESEDTAGNIGLAFAIPINQAKRIAQEIIATGKARRTVFGARVEGARTPGGGVRLAAVEAAGPAGAAGLRAGDVVTKLDGRVLVEPVDLIALVRKYAPGAVVRIEYRRGGNRQAASVTLAADAK